MQGYNMCRWCYFSSHSTLGLKWSAAIVNTARLVTEHSNGLMHSALEHWPSARLPPPAHCFVVLCVVHLLSSSLCFVFSYLSSPSLSHLVFLLTYFLPTLLLHPQLIPYIVSFGHPLSSPFSSPQGHPCSLLFLIIIASDEDGDSISGILK